MTYIVDVDSYIYYSVVWLGVDYRIITIMTHPHKFK